MDISLNDTRLARAAAVLVYLSSYLFFSSVSALLNDDNCGIYLIIISSILITANEIVIRINRGNEAARLTAEDIVWYSAMMICSIYSFGLSYADGKSFSGNVVFNNYCLYNIFFYAIVQRGGRLLAGKTSGYILLDIFNSRLILPFSHFADIIRDIKSKDGKRSRGSTAIGILALCAVIPIFISAVYFLSDMDKDFKVFIFSYLDIDSIASTVIKLVFAVPVTFYVYGLFSGSDLCIGEEQKRRYSNVIGFIDRLRAAPMFISIVILSVFDALYIIFGVFRARYYFTAFTGKVLEGFSYSGYAREGFFELCAIMALNILVVAVIRIFAIGEDFTSKPVKLLMGLLMSESVFFAVSSLSKIILYFNRYGFTPKRVLSMWAVTVFIYATAEALLYVFKKLGNPVRRWLNYTLVSYLAVMGYICYCSMFCA